MNDLRGRWFRRPFASCLHGINENLWFSRSDYGLRVRVLCSTDDVLVQGHFASADARVESVRLGGGPVEAALRDALCSPAGEVACLTDTPRPRSGFVVWARWAKIGVPLTNPIKR